MRARRSLTVVLVGWAVATVAAGVAAHRWSKITPIEAPSDGAWLLGSLRAVLDGQAVSSLTPPALKVTQVSRTPIEVTAWIGGRAFGKWQGTTDLMGTLRDVAPQLAKHRFIAQLKHKIVFTATMSLGEGPIWEGVPWVSALQLVPRREGIVGRVEDRVAYLTPDELIGQGLVDRGVVVRLIPDMSFGVDLKALRKSMAKALGVTVEDFEARGTMRRFYAHTVTETPYPAVDAPLTESRLRQAAVEGAEFLLRHQKRDGRYTYQYDGVKGRAKPSGYNLPRHAGTTYFLAQMDHLHQMPEARDGAIKALGWLQKHRFVSCGPQKCVGHGRVVEIGSAALTVVAAAEVLAKADDPLARALVVDLTAFIRSQQRPDGELMHEYDRKDNKPIDVQRMFYSGEAAFALLRAYRVLGDEANLTAAKKLMKHLTGSGWNFLGSRYYYGEEHWTCIAAGEARGLIDRADSVAALDFCNRWAEFSELMQFDETQTPWAMKGAYGVGPFLMPRLSPVGSRTEAFVATYELAVELGAPTDRLRRLVQDGIGCLLRWRWAPGPTHLLANPAAARGGMPATPIDLTVRNDYVQHVGSAWIRWADVMARQSAQP